MSSWVGILSCLDGSTTLLARFLQKPNGCAHIREVVIELWGERDIDSIEQTITRRINDFCSRVTQKGPEEVLHRRGLSACPKSGD
jgi:hypothetical protein